MWYQQTLTLRARSRGFHLVTDEVLGQIRDLSRINVGLLHLLLQHTSAPHHPHRYIPVPTPPDWPNRSRSIGCLLPR